MCKCYNEIMTEDKFLISVRQNYPENVACAFLALRFVPMFKRQMKNVSRAQKAMGLYRKKAMLTDYAAEYVFLRR